MELLKSKFKIIFLIVVVIFGSVIIANHFEIYQKIIKPVFADDEEEEDDDHYEVINTSPSGSSAKKSETKTITTKLADTITQTTTTTVKYDSDGDGKYDEEDPHPTINEYFIVKDDNLNGIDDQYEQ